MTDSFAPDVLMPKLAAHRQAFHSEADFQHALAWLIRQEHQEAAIRLEVPARTEGRRQSLDLLVQAGGARIGYELKYLTRAASFDLGGERYELRDQGAQDIIRYDILKDVLRLERFVADGWLSRGYGIALTNDSAYWAPGPLREVAYTNFSLHEQRVISGALRWGATAGAGTMRGRETPLDLAGTYAVAWQDYSEIPTARYARLRFLQFAVQSSS